ncbi:MAG TPA: hypothetical protein VK190_02455 [Pseudoneobacillus sp.]|nr:hypothetical protein [Pseudoneobacillus sp.]
MIRIVLQDSQSYIIQDEETDTVETFAKEHGFVEPYCVKGRDDDDPLTYMIIDKVRGISHTYMEDTIELIKEKILEDENKYSGGGIDGDSGSI